VILDVDSGGFKFLAQAIGKKDQVEEIHKEYNRRRKKGHWGLKQLAELFAGESYLTLEKIAEEFCRTNLMPGAKETIEKLKSERI
jgi:phosphoserine phosphatase